MVVEIVVGPCNQVEVVAVALGRCQYRNRADVDDATYW